MTEDREEFTHRPSNWTPPSWAKSESVTRPVVFDALQCCDYSPPGSSVHGILQARILEWVVIPFSRGSSRPRDQTWVSCKADRFPSQSVSQFSRSVMSDYLRPYELQHTRPPCPSQPYIPPYPSPAHITVDQTSVTAGVCLVSSVNCRWNTLVLLGLKLIQF